MGPKIFAQKVLAPRFFNRPGDEGVVKKAVDEELPPMIDYLENQIGSRQWMVWDRFTIADLGIATQFVNFQLAGFNVDPQRWPRLAVYLERVHSRPSFRSVIEKEKAMFASR